MKKLSIIDPATEDVIAELDEDTKQSLQNKFELLKAAQRSWQQTPLPERTAIIQKFSDLLEVNKEELASILTSEVGKPLQQSRNEINGGRARIKWLTENADKYLSDEIMNQQKGMEEKISYEPLGVILQYFCLELSLPGRNKCFCSCIISRQCWYYINLLSILH
jgi:acyl-CoA reductase-like NAD-dependent aldehyde dehydrogenase